MAKAVKRRRSVPAKRKRSVGAVKAKPKISKKSATVKARPAKSTDRTAGIEKSILSLRAILQEVKQTIAEIELQVQPFEDRLTNIEKDTSDLKDSFDTRIDHAIFEIAEHIESQRLARRHGNPTREPSSGPLASAIAKFEETGLKGTWLNGSFGSNSR